MKARSFRLTAGLTALALISMQPPSVAFAQTAAPAAAPAPATAAATDLLSEDELEILVARIALYPDELVAAISAASLFPLQIVEAERFLEAKKKNADLKPKDDWDGSVISLLNYPDIVKMMSEDLDWTQKLGDALTNQQKDVLVAIQQLRDEAVAKNIIKTDDKVTVATENNNVVIRPTDPEKVYIPQYEPKMLYEPGYAPEPISYYPSAYDSYYYPGAAFFAAAVTGVAWAAIVNWDDWGVWGGRWNGDVDIDCRNCFNDRNFNGKVKWNDVDWTKVDRSKLSIDKSQFADMDRTAIKSSLQSDNRNQLKNQVGDRRGDLGQGGRNTAARADDIRKGTANGLKAKGNSAVGNMASGLPNAGNRAADASRPDARPGNAGANRPSAGNVKNKSGAPKMAARPDNRPQQPNALGNPQSSGRREAVASQRGGQSMGGGQRGGQRAQSRPAPRSYGGGAGRGGGGHSRPPPRGGGGRR
jgi:hypothetical protein